MHDFDEIETDKNKTLLSSSQSKGNCNDCDYYYDCPRMKGINECYNTVKQDKKSD